jgi:hypothetical protein
MIKKILKFTGIGAILFVALIGIGLLLLQTERAKEKIRKSVLSFAARHQIAVEVESIEGSLPLKLTLNQLYLKTREGIELDIDRAKIRLAILPLLYREIQFSYFAADHVRLTIPDALIPVEPPALISVPPSERKPASLPFTFSAKTIKTPHLKIIHKGEQLDLALDASGKLKRNLDLFYAELRAVPLSSPLSFIDCSLQGNFWTKYIGAKCTTHITSTRFFSSFIPLSFDTEGFFTAQVEGHWETWRTLLKQSSSTNTPPLKAFFKGLTTRFELPGYPQLNQKWKIATSFSVAPDRSLTISKSHLSSDLITLTGQAKIDSTGSVEEGNLSFKLPQLTQLGTSLPVQGSLKGKVLYQNSSALIKLSSSNLRIGSDYYTSFEAILRGKKEDSLWNGRGELSFGQEDIPLKISSDFTVNGADLISLKDLTLVAPEMQLNGNLCIQLASRSLQGELFAQSTDLSRFQKWFPGSKLRGRMGVEAHFDTRLMEGEPLSQELKLHLRVNDFAYRKLTAQEMILDGELIDIFKTLEGKIRIDAQKAQYASLLLSQLHINTQSTNGKWPFSLHAKGMWADGLDVASSGAWSRAGDQVTIQVGELTGFMFKKPFALQKPLQVAFSKDTLAITDWDMRLADGGFVLDLDLGKSYSKGNFKAEHFPLDLLLISSPTLSFSGNTSIDAAFEATPETVEGHLNLLLEHANLTQMGKTEAVLAKGYLQTHFNQEVLQLHAGIKASQDQFFEWTATLPLIYTANPLQLKLDETRPFSSKLDIDGKLEEIFDFINIGSHQITGQLACHLFASKTLASPIFLGTVELTNGSYENIRTGTYLENIQSEAQSQNQLLEIVKFTATDHKEGTITAQGKLEIKPLEFFPYSVTAELDNLNAIRSDAISANFSGPVEISGTTKGATASGNLTVSKAEVDIPDDIPCDIPVLPVTYINQPEGREQDRVVPLTLFPFTYDLTLSAPAATPGHMIVRGKGLRSEWRGDIHLSGKNADMSLSGTLTLLRGEFVFSGKVFALTQGEITIIDKPQQTAHLSLSGTLDLPDATITAILSGPLTAPQLTFQSTPHMATSSILARILFNKDISQISPIQAVQLAQTIMTMAGSAGPDVLEKIRRGLGVDRLNIVSCPTGPLGNDETISVQIGKYLTKGVMVTLSQSADSSNVIVEVELKKGFIFQAETQENQEGKFTLKWNRNY